MADLQKGKSFTTLVGKVKITDKTFSGVQVSSTTGYTYVRINLGVETDEGNVVYCEMMGGYSPAKPVIYAMNKEDNSAFTVNWADRLTESIVDSVADFKVHKIGLERDEQGNLIMKKFLSPMDVHDYLKANLKDGMEVVVRGAYAFSEYNEKTQRKFEIQNIFLPYPKKDEDGNVLPTEYKAEFTQTILLDEESFKKITKEDAKAGEVVVSAYAVDYVGKKNGKPFKKNVPFNLPITVRIDKENPEKTEKILNALFKVKKGKIRELTIEGQIVEGYDKQEVSNEDIKLSAEIQELIELGLYSEEEAKEKMTVRGNKVSKLVFVRPFIQKDKEDAKKIKVDISDDKYTPEDLIVAPPMEEDSTDEAFTDAGSTSADDNSWMSALGI